MLGAKARAARQGSEGSGRFLTSPLHRIAFDASASPMGRCQAALCSYTRARRSLSADILRTKHRATGASLRALPAAQAADAAATIAAVVLALAHADADASAAIAALCALVAAGARPAAPRAEPARGRTRRRRAARRALSAEALRQDELMARLGISSVRGAFESLCALRVQVRQQARPAERRVSRFACFAECQAWCVRTRDGAPDGLACRTASWRAAWLTPRHACARHRRLTCPDRRCALGQTGAGAGPVGTAVRDERFGRRCRPRATSRGGWSRSWRSWRGSMITPGSTSMTFLVCGMRRSLPSRSSFVFPIIAYFPSVALRPCPTLLLIRTQPFSRIAARQSLRALDSRATPIRFVPERLHADRPTDRPGRGRCATARRTRCARGSCSAVPTRRRARRRKHRRSKRRSRRRAPPPA